MPSFYIVIQGNTFTGYCDATTDSVSVTISVQNTTMFGLHTFQCNAQNPVGNSSVLATVHITGK